MKFLLVHIHAAIARNRPGTRTDLPPPARLCDSQEYRQFDFWVGDWDVTSNGQPAGTNSIHAIHNGCAPCRKTGRAPGHGGISGTSFNIYDQATGRWHQTWVDSSGTLLLLGRWLAGWRHGPER